MVRLMILLIEDDDDKAESISGVISMVSGMSLERVTSLTGGIRFLAGRGSEVELVLLDMTMPTFDRNDAIGIGSETEPLGGIQLLSQMQLRGIIIPVVVVTMFDDFGGGEGRMSLESLHEDLESRFASLYRGYIYYSSAQSEWRDQLLLKIERHLGGRR